MVRGVHQMSAGLDSSRYSGTAAMTRQTTARLEYRSRMRGGIKVLLSSGALRWRGVLRPWLAGRQHVGGEQDHRLAAEVAADVDMGPSRRLDEGPAHKRHLGRAIVQRASQRAGLHDGDHLAIVVVPARRAAGGDRDLEDGHVGLLTARDHDAVRRRARGQDGPAHPCPRCRGHRSRRSEQKRQNDSDKTPTNAAHCSSLGDRPRTTLGLEDSLDRWRKLCELLDRPSRPNDQLAAAIRTSTTENALGTGTTEGALKRADPSFRRVRWKITIAAFTVGTKLEHSPLRSRGRPRFIVARRYHDQRHQFGTFRSDASCATPSTWTTVARSACGPRPSPPRRSNAPGSR